MAALLVDVGLVVTAVVGYISDAIAIFLEPPLSLFIALGIFGWVLGKFSRMIIRR